MLLEGYKQLAERDPPPFTSRMSPAMAKMRNSYNLDVDEAEMDEKIRILEKHHKMAEKQKMIAELENKTKKLEEEWAVHKFGQPGLWSEHCLFTHLREQEVKLRTAKHEIQKITDNRDRIIENYNYYHKELRAEKEKFEQEASKLNDILAEKDGQIQQKDEVMSELNDIAAEKDEQLKQKEEEVSDLNDLVAKKNE